VDALLHVMESYLVDFNATSKRPMNLAMFLFAVEHISRICRCGVHGCSLDAWVLLDYLKASHGDT
jgi:hypothetical protein